MYFVLTWAAQLITFLGMRRVARLAALSIERVVDLQLRQISHRQQDGGWRVGADEGRAVDFFW